MSSDSPIATCTPRTTRAQTLVSRSHSPLRGFRATMKNGCFQGRGRKPQGELVQRVRKCSETNGDRPKDMEGAWNGHHGPDLGRFKHQNNKLSLLPHGLLVSFGLMY